MNIITHKTQFNKELAEHLDYRQYICDCDEIKKTLLILYAKSLGKNLVEIPQKAMERLQEQLDGQIRLFRLTGEIDSAFKKSKGKDAFEKDLEYLLKCLESTRKKREEARKTEYDKMSPEDREYYDAFTSKCDRLREDFKAEIAGTLKIELEGRELEGRETVKKYMQERIDAGASESEIKERQRYFDSQVAQWNSYAKEKEKNYVCKRLEDIDKESQSEPIEGTSQWLIRENEKKRQEYLEEHPDEREITAKRDFFAYTLPNVVIRMRDWWGELYGNKTPDEVWIKTQGDKYLEYQWVKLRSHGGWTWNDLKSSDCVDFPQ